MLLPGRPGLSVRKCRDGMPDGDVVAGTGEKAFP